jgi:uncharacterized damage-inducible protein DinB
MKAALCVVVLVGIFAAPGLGQEKAGGFRGDLVGHIEYVQKQITDLLGAIPEKKLSWSPGKGVRSIGQVYMHITMANYMLPKFAGIEIPADVKLPEFKDMMKWEASFTKKSDIAGMMEKSFAHLKNAIVNMSDADLEKPVTFFGQETNVRGLLLTAFAHHHEHLGQSIAYARMNGIVPPWTAAQQAAESKGN